MPRNKLNLSLNVGVAPASPVTPTTPLVPPELLPESARSIESPARLLPKMDELDFSSDTQRQNYEAFVFNKAKFLDIKSTSPDDFKLVKTLGKGNGGVVYAVRHKPTDLLLARKMIHLELKPEVRQQILRELTVLHECNSPYIVGFYGSFYADGDINLLMEFMDMGSLDKVVLRVCRIQEDISAQISLSVLRGLAYLRDNFKIIHRDVKPSNVLVNSAGEVKLCDFGVSGELQDSLANTFVGTRSYMSPERLVGSKYAVTSDIWSLGVTLIEIATGRFPFPPPSDPTQKLPPIVVPTGQEIGKPKKVMAIFELLAHIVEDPPPRLPEHVGFSKDFVDFVTKCCTKDPSHRPGLKELLAHPWSTRAADTREDMVAWIKSTVPRV
eukprot:m.1434841 g.1434841  ORF g.1434841 m.1434841 type:complete len:383 (+) comp25081_c2_seq23:127-1275(+)